jgi:hypothetical protein
MQKFESESNKINDILNDYKSHTDASMNGLRSLVNQNSDEPENKIDELTYEVKNLHPV